MLGPVRFSALLGLYIKKFLFHAPPPPQNLLLFGGKGYCMGASGLDQERMGGGGARRGKEWWGGGRRGLAMGDFFGLAPPGARNLCGGTATMLRKRTVNNAKKAKNTGNRENVYSIVFLPPPPFLSVVKNTHPPRRLCLPSAAESPALRVRCACSVSQRSSHIWGGFFNRHPFALLVQRVEFRTKRWI